MSTLPPDYVTPRDQDAWATIRGFVYQVDITLLRWLRLEEGRVLELERGEDIDVVASTLAAQASEFDRLLEQVKHLERSITLRTPAALEAVANAIEHRQANPGLHLQFCFTTTADVGTEQRSPDPRRRPLISIWEGIREGTLAGDERLDSVELIAEFLRSQPKPESINVDRWHLLQAVVTEADRSGFGEFIADFQWSTRCLPSDEVRQRIESLLVETGLANSEEDAQQKYLRLFVFVFKLLTQPGVKQLSVDLLSQQLDAPLSAEDQRLESIIHLRFNELSTRVNVLEQTVGELARRCHIQGWDRDECCRQFRYKSGRHLVRETVAGWRLTECTPARHGIL